ncbi:L-aspartate oxidase [uncultured Alistipes sp.]|uniref:L-aspartate oxidase n=1 Tax=uncultured Alistipes sp. TaxID=538949 RepID=UPI00262C8E6F|nr:L-aspartate oxidase [uncultured Alistipes sp.]
MNIETDFLVIGSGIAGLSFALKAAEHGHVTIVTKSELGECNTDYAQGGIASVMYEPDTFEKHIHDTLVCGAGICDRAAVEQVVRNAPGVIKQLIQWGTKFDKDASGRYDLNREGGHSEHRILHHDDLTGHEIERALMKRVKRHRNIDIYEHHFAVDILTQHHLGRLVRKSTPDITCFGAYVLNLKKHEIHTVLSKVTVMATGGVGNIYHTTTNPSVATGDGVAMVHRAKGAIENMEFIQFHPTSLYNPGERPSFLITEAMRGFGGLLRLQNGKEFMQKYHPMGSLAPRDVVARSIDHELKISGEEFVYLDITHKDPKEVTSHFPNIYRKCLSVGIDLTKDMIPVVPAAHYCCGGIKVDLNGESSIRRLYALGEASSTGLHGGNRLASNSMMEAAVYADAAARHAISAIGGIEWQRDIPAWDDEGTAAPEEMALITQNYKEMQQIMSNYVGIVRSNLRLERAKRRLEIIYKETEELYLKSTLSQHLCELRNMIAVGYLIIKQAEARHESVGLHYSIDYPSKPFDV